jgi:predicted nucleic acid-binding protein
MVYCKLYDEVRGRGEMIPDADLLIAASAISHNLTLRTRDEHFVRLEPLGLKVERPRNRLD